MRSHRVLSVLGLLAFAIVVAFGVHRWLADDPPSRRATPAAAEHFEVSAAAQSMSRGQCADGALQVETVSSAVHDLSPALSPPANWAALIARYANTENAIALQAIVEARPGSTPSERAQLLAAACRALASLGPKRRLAFDDLLASPHREVRLAALNAIAVHDPTALSVLETMSADPDPVIRRKLEALRRILR